MASKQPSDPNVRPDSWYASVDWDDNPLDAARAASMADEGGVSAASIDACEPYIEIEIEEPGRGWRKGLLWAFTGAAAAFAIGAFAVTRGRRLAFYSAA